MSGQNCILISLFCTNSDISKLKNSFGTGAFFSAVATTLLSSVFLPLKLPGMTPLTQLLNTVTKKERGSVKHRNIYIQAEVFYMAKSF